jgi:hypothetical protein
MAAFLDRVRLTTRVQPTQECARELASFLHFFSEFLLGVCIAGMVVGIRHRGWTGKNDRISPECLFGFNEIAAGAVKRGRREEKRRVVFRQMQPASNSTT